MKNITILLCAGFFQLTSVSLNGQSPFVTESRNDAKNRASVLSEAIRPQYQFLKYDDDSKRSFLINQAFDVLYAADLNMHEFRVPVSTDTMRALAEAKSLAKSGAKEESVRILRALAAIPTVLPLAGVRAISDSTEANRLLMGIHERETDDLNWDLTDPYPLFVDETGETTVFFDRHSWRFSLPGYWRFAPETNLPEGMHGGYLRHSEYFVFARSVDRDHLVRKIEDLIKQWDSRRGLTGPRKQKLNFFRKDLTVADGAGYFQCNGADLCRSFRVFAKYGNHTLSGYEFYVIRPTTTIHIRFLFPGVGGGSEAGIRDRIVDSLRR